MLHVPTGGAGWDPTETRDNNTPTPARPPFALADVATLASLLALQPQAMLEKLPTEMKALGSSFAHMLLGCSRPVLLSCDRAALLVAQDLHLAVAAMLRLSPTAAAWSAAPNTPEQWLARATATGTATATAARALSISDILPARPNMHGHATPTPGATAAPPPSEPFDEEALLLLRLRELQAWAVAGGEYQQLMSAAKPLRRVLPPATNSRRSRGGGAVAAVAGTATADQANAGAAKSSSRPSST